MYQNRFVLCAATAALALAVACSKTPQTPVSPAASTETNGDAAPDGSTLKVTAPAPQSPVNGAQPLALTLVAGVSSAQFPGVSVPPLSYEFQILTAAGSVINGCTTIVSASGSTVSASPACTIEFNANHRWRVRARLGSAVGPWSADASFRSPSGGYINGNEIYDPLYNGISVGQRVGSTTFIPNAGLRLDTHESRVEYLIPQLQAGEISVMTTGVAEDNPGDKTKIFTMQEGNGGNITDNDYRMTVEKRGRSYSTPGAVTWRIIMGDADEHNGRIFDAPARIGLDFSDERWYFWKFTWGSRAELTVREDGPNGRVIYQNSRGTGSFLYRPVPHYVYIGSPVGRGGAGDASIPGAIYKNFWVSSRPRPVFPNE